MSIIISDDEMHFIAVESGIDDDIVKSWYKDFIKMCPNGKMVKKNLF
jgi:hypothetical protein